MCYILNSKSNPRLYWVYAICPRTLMRRSKWRRRNRRSTAWDLTKGKFHRKVWWKCKLSSHHSQKCPRNVREKGLCSWCLCSWCFDPSSFAHFSRFFLRSGSIFLNSFLRSFHNRRVTRHTQIVIARPTQQFTTVNCRRVVGNCFMYTEVRIRKTCGR